MQGLYHLVAAAMKLSVLLEGYNGYNAPIGNRVDILFANEEALKQVPYMFLLNIIIYL
ncbi:MAG: hypothetical protein WAM42_02220 [Candidatus Nitrosopolaris sp.]|jgi:hypothetical protein